LKKDRYDLLDPAEKHTLSEMECELVGFFRVLNKTRQQIVLQMLFSAVADDPKIDREVKKRERSELVE